MQDFKYMNLIQIAEKHKSHRRTGGGGGQTVVYAHIPKQQRQRDWEFKARCPDNPPDSF